MANKQDTASVLKTATALTDAYADGWDSGWHDVGLATHARFLLTLVKDGATTVELALQVDEHNGTTGYDTFKIANGAASLDEVQLTCADLDATHEIALPIDVTDVRRVRLRAKRTGGDSGTTLAASILVGVIR